MRKITQKEKVKIHKQLEKEKYAQGGHTVNMPHGPVIVIVTGKDACLPTGRKLPVPEEWWV